MISRTASLLVGVIVKRGPSMLAGNSESERFQLTDFFDCLLMAFLCGGAAQFHSLLFRDGFVPKSFHDYSFSLVA